MLWSEEEAAGAVPLRDSIALHLGWRKAKVQKRDGSRCGGDDY